MSYGYTLLSESHPVARKQHRCIWCGESIKPGEKYRRERSVFDGNMQDFAWHPECAQAQQDEIRATGEPEFSAYENERPATAGVTLPPSPDLRSVLTVLERLLPQHKADSMRGQIEAAIATLRSALGVLVPAEGER